MDLKSGHQEDIHVELDLAAVLPLSLHFSKAIAPVTSLLLPELIYKDISKNEYKQTI